MKVKNNLIAALVSMVFFVPALTGQYHINFKIDDYTNDTLIIGYYYGEKQLVKDTVYATKPGEFTFKGKDTLNDGMYIALLKPDNTFVQFIVSGNDNKFDVKFKKSDTAKLTFKNSPENKRFYDYMDYIKQKREEASPLRDSLTKLKEKEKDDPSLKAKLEKIDAEVKAYQEKFVKDNKGTYTANLIYSNFEVTIPEFDGPEEETQLKRYRYYKQHYWDYMDWEFPALIHTPYIHQKLDYYVKKLTVQNPDSIIISVREILDKLEKNPEAQKYYLSHFLNEYANSKIIGMDKIFVYLSDNYYAKGKATWVKEENLKKIIESADNLRNILIGEIFPNITTYKEDNTPVVLHNVKSKYILLVFWAPDCGHCKKAMPDIIKFDEEFKNQGVTTITVCTKGGDKANTCWEGIKEKNMESLINTGDQYQRYRQIVHFQTTPKLFILDAKKEILFKDLPSEELGNVMKEIIKMDAEKK